MREPAPDSPAAPRRSDARRSRAKLLRAAGDLLSTGRAFNLSDVAAEAGVSTATAYRHFGSARDVADVYVSGFLDDVEQRRARAVDWPADPAERVRAVNRLWVDAVLDWGPPLTHLRSTEGFLGRLGRGDPSMRRAAGHVRDEFAALLGVDADHPDALYLVSAWNALCDPREILDQHSSLGWSPARIADRLDAALTAITAALGQERPG